MTREDHVLDQVEAGIDKVIESEEGMFEFYAKVAALLHYPECWDTAVYTTLYDAIFEFWDGCQVCKDPDSFIGEVDE